MVNQIDATAFREFELAGWQRATEHYADVFGALTAQAVPEILAAIGIAPGLKLLDVATGPGYVAAAAHEQGAIVAGIDFSPAMVAEARRRSPAVTFSEGDAEALPFPDHSFDAIVMSFGLLHLSRPELAIAEAHRVLRYGGRYAFTVWARPDEAVGFGAALNAIEAHGRLDVGLPPGPPFFRFSDHRECAYCLEQAGFAHIEIRQLPLVWHVASPDAVFEALMRGGVRTAAVLRAQTPEALNRIREAISDAMQPFVKGSTVAIPMPAILASGVKRGTAPFSGPR